MNKSTTKSRGRPRKDSDQFGIRLDRDVINAIDQFILDEPDNPKRPEAIRRLLRESLEKLGYLEP